jgi:hypothetical protein
MLKMMGGNPAGNEDVPQCHPQPAALGEDR